MATSMNKLLSLITQIGRPFKTKNVAQFLKSKLQKISIQMYKIYIILKLRMNLLNLNEIHSLSYRNP